MLVVACTEHCDGLSGIPTRIATKTNKHNTHDVASIFRGMYGNFPRKHITAKNRNFFPLISCAYIFFSEKKTIESYLGHYKKIYKFSKIQTTDFAELSDTRRGIPLKTEKNAQNFCT